MTSTEFFAMLGMTGVVLGPYLFYEAKGLPMKGFGTAITIGSLIVLFHYALTFLTFHPFAPPSLRSLVLCLPFAVLSGLIIPPLKGYWDFQADRTKAHELRIKIEAFELEANQRKPIDTDSSLHEKRQVEHKLWTETEFRKRFTEDVRKIYPKMFPHPNSLLQTEMAADDLTIQSARLWSARLILVAQLRGEALATFSLDSWFKDNWKVRIIRQCLIVTLLVWGALFWVSSK